MLNTTHNRWYQIAPRSRIALHAEDGVREHGEDLRDGPTTDLVGHHPMDLPY